MTSGRPAAVLVVDPYHGPREVHVLAPTRDTILGGRDADVDVGAQREVARIVPTRDEWHVHVADDAPDAGGFAPQRLHHGQMLPVFGCRVRFLLAEDPAHALDEDRYVTTILDPLTQVFTRRFVAAHVHRIQPPAAVLAIDLDRFKHVNDRHGFMVGDRVLQETSARIQAQVRWPELVARIGGEEFLVILPRTSLQRAIERAEAIRRAVEPVFEIESEQLISTVSIGVAVFAAAGEPAFLEAWRTAEHHLELAKTRGRNRVVASEHG